MKVFVDPDICIGCGVCPQLCPDVFKMENEKAIVYAQPVAGVQQDACKDAVAQCPVTAIRIEE